MGVLEQITQMKSQGVPDDEIVGKLTEQGISPKAINDALSQSQVKSAVSDIEDQGQVSPASSGAYSPQTQEMAGQESYAPSAQDYAQAQDYSQTQGYTPQEGYGYSGGGGMATDTDTMIEISEQVFSEKMKKIQNKVDELSEFKALAQTKIEHSAERLNRIETTMDKLQLAILDKIGSYGKNLESMKKEMSMMQNSFGKMVGKVAEKAAIQHTTSVKKSTPKKIAKKTVKKKTSKKK